MLLTCPPPLVRLQLTISLTLFLCLSFPSPFSAFSQDDHLPSHSSPSLRPLYLLITPSFSQPPNFKAVPPRSSLINAIGSLQGRFRLPKFQFKLSISLTPGPFPFALRSSLLCTPLPLSDIARPRHPFSPLPQRPNTNKRLSFSPKDSMTLSPGKTDDS